MAPPAASSRNLAVRAAFQGSAGVRIEDNLTAARWYRGAVLGIFGNLLLASITGRNPLRRTSTAAVPEANTMRHGLGYLPILLITSALTTLIPGLAGADPRLRVQGAGATLPAPLYLAWARAYRDEHSDTQIDYQANGSANGLNDLDGGRVDFAGADFLLPPDKASTLAGGVAQLPMAAAGIAIIYNLDGVDGLKLSRAALIGIFDGSVARWNDPAIAAANPGTDLADKPITLVARVGASGTCYNLTRHLSRISPEFEKTVGIALKPVWPAAISERGGLVKARGNDGIAAMVQAIDGSLGYVSYPFAYFGKIPMASIENQAGNYVAADPAGFAAAMTAIRARGPDLADELAEDRIGAALDNLIDPPGDDSYPIIAISWISLPKTPKDPPTHRALMDFLDYAVGPGQAMVERVGYIPFSANGIEVVKQEIEALR
jgi:phosphate transport system substrate-binding protein